MKRLFILIIACSLMGCAINTYYVLPDEEEEPGLWEMLDELAEEQYD
ncbi:MAG: hypothetical protein HWN81_00510 [Candidatus Lokiarchaeota archaeon]|nr:hypothetical protein [Candidatus Lokiarchaeota archaeon]